MKTKHSATLIAGVLTLILVTALFSNYANYFSDADNKNILILHSGDFQGQLGPCG